MKRMNLKQLYLTVFIIMITSCLSPQSKSEDNPVNLIKTDSGILLNFDDYHPVEWANHFDLFDTYGAKVTFFIHEGDVYERRNNGILEFCLNAQNRGHEIGYHTLSHPHLTALTREQFFEQTVSRINVFKNAGIELTSFAFPFGTHRPWMHTELLKHYKIIRGISGYKLYTKEEMKSGFIDSESIDNTKFQSESHFQTHIDYMLKSARDADKIIVLTSHDISKRPYAITPERLEYVLSKSKEYGLTFYRFKDLQDDN